MFTSEEMFSKFVSGRRTTNLFQKNHFSTKLKFTSNLSLESVISMRAIKKKEREGKKQKESVSRERLEVFAGLLI